MYINIIKKITRADSRTLWAAHEWLSDGQMSLTTMRFQLSWLLLLRVATHVAKFYLDCR